MPDGNSQLDFSQFNTAAVTIAGAEQQLRLSEGALKPYHGCVPGTGRPGPIALGEPGSSATCPE